MMVPMTVVATLLTASGLTASGLATGSGAGGMGSSEVMGGMGPERVDAHALTSWAAGPFAVAVAVVTVALLVGYIRAVRIRDGRARSAASSPWPRARIVSFAAGLLAIEVALGSPVATLAGSHFPAHIIQHLLLMMIAPPLLALAAPMTLLLQTTSRPTKRRLLGALHSIPFAVISHPVTVFFLYYGSMFAFFLTPALGYVMDRMWLMDLVNLGFLAGATLFWWPMVGTDPIPRWSMTPGLKILNLLIGVPFESFLSIALLLMASPAAPMYSLASTHAGGGALWALSELLTAVALAPVFVQWTRADARLARRIDARLDAGLGLAPPAMDGHGLSATMRMLKRG